MSRAVLVVTTIIVLGALAGGRGRSITALTERPRGRICRRTARCRPRSTRSTWWIAQGLGAGMAFAADQNGYPGPRHVLELKDRLRLTPAQEARITTLETAMFAESRGRRASVFENAEARPAAALRGRRRGRGGVSAWPWRRWSAPARSSGSCIS
jgi:hypothetical protein